MQGKIYYFFVVYALVKALPPAFFPARFFAFFIFFAVYAGALTLLGFAPSTAFWIYFLTNITRYVFV